MKSVEIQPDSVQDPREQLSPGLGLGRVPVRTPMRWSSEPNAGFSKPEVTPWLPIGGDFRDKNVEAEKEDPNSMLTFFRELIAIRRNSAALKYGSCTTLVAPKRLLAYVREYRSSVEKMVVIINFNSEEKKVKLANLLRGLTEDEFSENFEEYMYG